MQPRWLLFALPLLAVAVPGGAHADDDADEKARYAKSDINAFASANASATKAGFFGNNYFFRDPSECTKAIESGTAAGLKATDTYTDGDGNTVLWKRASAVCDEYARLHPLRKVIDELAPQLQTIRAFRDLNPSGAPDKSVRGDAFRATVKDAQACIAAADKAMKAGVPSDVAFAPNDNSNEPTLTLAQARAECADYVTWGGEAAVADDKRAAEEIAALKAKYGKLGITGDRLDYLVKYGHRPVLGKGCGELAGKALKTAPAFFDLGQDDLAWIVYKTEFKKDKRVKYTSKRFRKDGDYRCK
jgi:hypothetical protein